MTFVLIHCKSGKDVTTNAVKLKKKHFITDLHKLCI